MLRVEFNHDENGRLTVRLQGRLVGPYAEDARIALERYVARPYIVVDLSEVTFVDSLGEQVLVWLGPRRVRAPAIALFNKTKWLWARNRY